MGIFLSINIIGVWVYWGNTDWCSVWQSLTATLTVLHRTTSFGRERTSDTKYDRLSPLLSEVSFFSLLRSSVLLITSVWSAWWKMLVFDNVWQCIYYVFVPNSKWSSNFLYWGSPLSPLSGYFTKNNPGIPRHSLSPENLSECRVNILSPCSLQLVAQQENTKLKIICQHLDCISVEKLTCSSELNGWIWIVVKNTHKCFLINHMEGKLAKHSVFFPIIEFLHLKSLNSNSQQFHVLLLGFEILTVTDRFSQSGWITFYYFTSWMCLKFKIVESLQQSVRYQSDIRVGRQLGRRLGLMWLQWRHSPSVWEWKSHKIKYLLSNLSSDSSFYFRT